MMTKMIFSILIILLFTGCAAMPTCNQYSTDVIEQEICEEQKAATEHYQENGWRYDRFDRR